MNQYVHKTEGVNRTQKVRFYPFTFTGNGPRKGWRTPLNQIICSEQRDALRLNPQSGGLRGARLTSPQDLLTGYGYLPRQARQAHHGARYMDHELMTMWLSVDPMADKYPSISPYAYCAWNPVKLVDPDGCMIDEWRIDLNTGEVTKVGNKGGKTTDYYSFGTTNTQGDWLPDATRDDVEISRNQSGGTINSFRVNESNNSTLSIFHIPDDDKSGFFLERGGPDTKAPNQNKRILEGEYNFVKHSSTDKFFNNRAKLTSKNDSKFVNRAILIHPGNNYWDSKGCLLPGTTASKNNNGDYSVGASKNKTAVLENYIRRNNWIVTLTITNRF